MCRRKTSWYSAGNFINKTFRLRSSRCRRSVARSCDNSHWRIHGFPFSYFHARRTCSGQSHPRPGTLRLRARCHLLRFLYSPYVDSRLQVLESFAADVPFRNARLGAVCRCLRYRRNGLPQSLSRLADAFRGADRRLDRLRRPGGNLMGSANGIGRVPGADAASPPSHRPYPSPPPLKVFFAESSFLLVARRHDLRKAIFSCHPSGVPRVVALPSSFEGSAVPTLPGPRMRACTASFGNTLFRARI